MADSERDGHKTSREKASTCLHLRCRGVRFSDSITQVRTRFSTVNKGGKAHNTVSVTNVKLLNLFKFFFSGQMLP